MSVVIPLFELLDHEPILTLFLSMSMEIQHRADEIIMEITNRVARKGPHRACQRPLANMEVEEGVVMKLFGQFRHIA
jgi:hypothetical protein